MSVALLPHTFEVKFKDNNDNFEWLNNWDNSSIIRGCNLGLIKNNHRLY